MKFGQTIVNILDAVRRGKLGATFSARDVNTALGITFAGTFLPKHRIGNPGKNTPLFVQVSSGQYKLNEEYIWHLGL